MAPTFAQIKAAAESLPDNRRQELTIDLVNTFPGKPGWRKIFNRVYKLNGWLKKLAGEFVLLVAVIM